MINCGSPRKPRPASRETAHQSSTTAEDAIKFIKVYGNHKRVALLELQKPLHWALFRSLFNSSFSPAQLK
jgi:hypothetical protein